MHESHCALTPLSILKNNPRMDLHILLSSGGRHSCRSTHFPHSTLASSRAISKSLNMSVSSLRRVKV